MVELGVEMVLGVIYVVVLDLSVVCDFIEDIVVYLSMVYYMVIKLVVYFVLDMFDFDLVVVMEQWFNEMGGDLLVVYEVMFVYLLVWDLWLYKVKIFFGFVCLFFCVMGVFIEFFMEMSVWNICQKFEWYLWVMGQDYCVLVGFDGIVEEVECWVMLQGMVGCINWVMCVLF